MKKKLESEVLEKFWNQMPVGKDCAVNYETLCNEWDCSARTARAILHELSCYDNGDQYVLIRSSKTKGFYLTDDSQEIATYRNECLNKGRSIFAAVSKCNRLLAVDKAQMALELGVSDE